MKKKNVFQLLVELPAQSGETQEFYSKPFLLRSKPKTGQPKKRKSSEGQWNTHSKLTFFVKSTPQARTENSLGTFLLILSLSKKSEKEEPSHGVMKNLNLKEKWLVSQNQENMHSSVHYSTLLVLSIPFILHRSWGRGVFLVQLPNI